LPVTWSFDAVTDAVVVMVPVAPALGITLIAYFSRPPAGSVATVIVLASSGHVAPLEASHWMPAWNNPLPRVTFNATLLAAVLLGLATTNSREEFVSDGTLAVGPVAVSATLSI
jgi:hypothetical protein